MARSKERHYGFNNEDFFKLGCPQVYRISLKNSSDKIPTRLSAGIGIARAASFVGESTNRVVFEANFHSVSNIKHMQFCLTI